MRKTLIAAALLLASCAATPVYAGTCELRPHLDEVVAGRGQLKDIPAEATEAVAAKVKTVFNVPWQVTDISMITMVKMDSGEFALAFFNKTGCFMGFIRGLNSQSLGALLDVGF